MKLSVGILFWLMVAASLVSKAAMGAPWLIAADSERIEGGRPFRLQVVKPDSVAEWPSTLALTLRSEEENKRVSLRLTDDTSPEATRRTYEAEAPAGTNGVVRAQLAEKDSNPVVLLGVQQDALTRMTAETRLQGADTQGSKLSPEQPEPPLSANEPMYFVVGARNGANARFQLSFKYRLFDEEGVVVRHAPWLRNFHFGYTQTSLWDLGAASKPFHDTSYRPSLFWQWRSADRDGWPRLWRAGYEHESNGKDGVNSRSIDTLFVQPIWVSGSEDETRFVFAPKFYGYLDKMDNPDIPTYRGYADWYFRYGREKGWLATALLRRGAGGYTGTQLDLSYPLREPVFSRVGGFLHFQLFSGYGESLLDYNLRRDTQVRVGFSIVR